MYRIGSPLVKMRGGSFRGKKGKKGQWGARERAGMSFLIVIAFFAVFGLIILTEVLMMDDRSRSPASVVRHISNNRFAESAPDYEEIKDDYLEETGIFVRENKDDSLKDFLKDAKPVEPRQNSIPVEESRSSGPNMAVIPWGQMLPSKVEKSLPSYSRESRPADGEWQIVNGTRYKFFVFSAFYDRRDGRMIRVVGATKTRGPEKVWCRLWYPLDANRTRFTSATIMARVKMIRENWNLKYSACFVLCPLRIAYLEVPYAVSIVSKLRSPPGNTLLVRNTDWEPDFHNRSSVVADIPRRMGICVKPLHFDYDQALHLLEFIELNAILGVTHFTLYNHTIGPKASCILNQYTTNAVVLQGLINNASTSTAKGNSSSEPTEERPTVSVEVLPWNLRMKSQKEIRTEGLFASLNDCLYRSMYR